MKKSDVVKLILKNKFLKEPVHQTSQSFAPSNIALCKYWGKRNQELNLPMTSSLSISLGDKGSHAQFTVNESGADTIYLNGECINAQSQFAKRLINYLNLFRKNNSQYFNMEFKSNIPVAAGLASSASGFAAIILALNALYDWQLTNTELSILARLGSGSASRSLWQGFVEWHAGELEDGMDSFAQPLQERLPDLNIGLLIFDQNEKPISSRIAMQQTVDTSSLYTVWPEKVKKDLAALKKAIAENNFELLGKTAESNALTMHATMLAAMPAISYWLPETVTAIRQIKQLRDEGLNIYFTQDAGPNLKLLFRQKDFKEVQQQFPAILPVF